MVSVLSTSGPSSHDLAEVFKYTTDMFNEDATAKGIKLAARVNPDAVVACDATMLMRILSNLVGNAIKYTDRGGVLLACRPHGDNLRLAVYDPRQGFADGEFAQLTQRAMRRLEDGDPAGHGLGLDITSVLIAEMGSAHECRSEPGRGSAIGFLMAKSRE